jgi:tetratricopeptide (TPR) repeat protein
LINASSELGDLRPPILIVLPSDVYNTLSEETRDVLEKEKYRLDVSQDLINTKFLAELIREYTRTKSNPNGCELSIDVFSKLADEVAGFDSGHALIARLIGEELARNNCDIGKIEELISKAKGKAEAFIILHINGLFKVDEDPDTAKALVEIFALRKPFVNEVGPGDPILTPGVVELISEVRGTKVLYGVQGGELRSWLARRQHDLIEDSIGGLLKCIVSEGEECKKFDDELLEPWKEAHVPKIRSRTDAVKYFTRKYGKRLIKRMRRHKNCWKRAAFIIGLALAGIPIVPRPEGLRKDFAESLGDALRECGVDGYLLVGSKIPPLIRRLIRNYARASTEAFIDRYNEAVGEVRRILNIARGRGSINPAEGLYGLGLASIIARAVESGKPVGPSDADTALHIASFAIQLVVSPDFTMSILSALVPLRGKAPHRFIELLALASNMENLDGDTVKYIFDELNEILGNYGDVVRGYAWSLVHAIRAYADLLRMHLVYFYGEIENIVGRVVYLLNELGRFGPSLGAIAWAFALAPALDSEYVRVLMEKALGIDVVSKASEVLEELGRLRDGVQELMSDKEFRSYIESKSVKIDEETVKTAILEASSHLKSALAHYRLNNDELDKAEELFNEAAEEDREIGDYEDYLIDRGLALRIEAIKGSLVGDDLVRLVDGFRQLYEEAFNEEHFEPTAPYLSNASLILGGYLVSLALMGDDKKINELLEEHWWVLNADEQASVLARLTLNALLGSRVELSGELEGRLVVEPRELIDAFGSDMHSEFLPALMVALGIVKPEDGIKLCEKFNGEGCVDFVLAVKGDSAAVEQLREGVINAFNNSLKGLSFDAESLINEFKGLVNGLDGKSLAQLIAPVSSMALLALMLHALINGDERLARAHALYGAVGVGGKLLTRLFLETYKECCDLKSESFRRAIARLFFYHV